MRLNSRQYIGFIVFFVVLFIHILLLKIQFPSKLVRKKSRENFLKVRLVDSTDRQSFEQIVESEDEIGEVSKKHGFLSDKTRSFERKRRARKIDKFSRSLLNTKRFKKKRVKKLTLSDLGKYAIQGSDYSQTQKQTQASSTSDYLNEIPLGDLTHLNTIEYKYYSYFNRIKQKLEHHWRKRIKAQSEVMKKNGGHISSSDNFVTSLEIILDANGSVIRVKVLETSGIREFDDIAEESFYECGPFSNPPKDLLKNGHLFMNWGFVIKTFD